MTQVAMFKDFNFKRLDVKDGAQFETMNDKDLLYPGIGQFAHPIVEFTSKTVKKKTTKKRVRKNENTRNRTTKASNNNAISSHGDIGDESGPRPEESGFDKI